MINISAKGQGADPRVDQAIEHLANVKQEIVDTDTWVEEIEQKIDALINHFKELSRTEAVDLEPLLRRIKILENLPPPPPPPPQRPLPLIPDIKPINKSISELSLKIEDVRADYNAEMSDMWTILKELPKLNTRVNTIEQKPEPTTDLTYVYVSIALVAVVNILLLGISIVL